MANEFTVTTAMKYSSGNDFVNLKDSYQVTQTSVPLGGAPGVQVVGTTHVALNVSGLLNLGMAYFKNLDDTNFVDIGVDVAAAFHPLIRLKPGEATVLRLAATSAPYAKADTAAVRLQANIYEE